MIRGRQVVTFLIALTLSLAITSKTFAQYGAYGGGYTTSVIIDKAIANPGTNTKGGSTEIIYLDNYSSSDYRFSPGQYMSFRLKVRNTSDVMLYGLKVKDFLPLYIEPVENPGEYNTSDRSITFDAGDFAVD